MPEDLSQVQRSDAIDNRERILRAARTLFAAEGLDVPMREVARRADVGPATLYRHFPTKEILATEALHDQMRACTAIVDEGLADPDPARGFRHVIERTFESNAHSRGFSEAFMSTFPRARDFAADREYTLKALAELANRAKDRGYLRKDFVLDDLILMLTAHRGIRADSPAARVAASRRFAAYVIQAFRASAETAPLPPPARIVPESIP
ncbi:TetR/AcrR family transcriptional regulator [Nocardia callitridis]|uniref:TetR/AcrR family transcriptional regulator n=1 Tax=Nocardia callitridis TaxID=648753 RepID=UPI0031EBC84C